MAAEAAPAKRQQAEFVRPPQGWCAVPSRALAHDSAAARSPIAPLYAKSTSETAGLVCGATASRPPGPRTGGRERARPHLWWRQQIALARSRSPVAKVVPVSSPLPSARARGQDASCERGQPKPIGGVLFNILAATLRTRQLVGFWPESPATCCSPKRRRRRRRRPLCSVSIHRLACTSSDAAETQREREPDRGSRASELSEMVTANVAAERVANGHCSWRRLRATVLHGRGHKPGSQVNQNRGRSLVAVALECNIHSVSLRA